VVDKETLSAILQTLADYVDELKSYRGLTRDQVVGDRKTQSAVRYALQTAIQSVLDAGLHVLVDDGLARPRDSREILQQLGATGVIPQDFAQRIEGMAGFRNLLVHRYGKVDAEIVYQHLRDRIADFELALRYLSEYLVRS
jgi:uncharacterized protein YutE (UPF0331/DUF86 family)